MKIRDKKLKVLVDVCGNDCPTYRCYWPRPDPGIFTQGQGYRTRESGSKGYLCGTREMHGCPDDPESRSMSGRFFNDFSNVTRVDYEKNT